MNLEPLKATQAEMLVACKHLWDILLPMQSSEMQNRLGDLPAGIGLVLILISVLRISSCSDGGPGDAVNKIP